MAALLVFLLLLAVPLTAFTTTDVYYVTAHDAAGHEQSCPPHQICHNLSYYISKPDSHFTSDTTIIFLGGEHSFDREDIVHVSNVHNLTLKGQGQWPVAGAEETVMQSTVIINCTRGRGGFYIGTSHNIIVEGLTVVNCGELNIAVFNFSTVQSLIFHKNSIQHMTGYGLFLNTCDNVIVTNCSYYHSTVCDFSNDSSLLCGGVGIEYDTQYSNTGYTLELSYSNMTKCCSIGSGGGVYLGVLKLAFHGKLLFNHLIFSHNKADHYGGGIEVNLEGSGNFTLNVSNCDFFNGTALKNGGGMHINGNTMQLANILLNDLTFSQNKATWGGGIYAFLEGSGNVALIVSNCDFFNGTALNYGGGMYIEGKMQSAKITLNNLKFSHNKADHGGGIYTFLGGNGNVALIVSNCDFFNGTALDHGGGLDIYVKMIQSANITLNDLKLSQNKADWGGGLYAYLAEGSGNVTLNVSNCDFFNGTVLNYGGGMYIEGKMQSANITLNDLKFSHNKADHGGGIYTFLEGSGNVALIVSNCDFFNGTALNYGGGLEIHVKRIQSANITLNDLKLSQNKADWGGGLYVYLEGSGNVTLNVSNCDFFNGTALKSGGGIYIWNVIQLANILFNHLKLSQNKANRGAGISAWFLSNDGVATLNISNCVISNGTAAHSGGGLSIVTTQQLNITIDNTDFVDNNGQHTGEIEVSIQTSVIYKNTLQSTAVYFTMLNSTVQHTKEYSDIGVEIVGYSAIVQIINTSMRFANVGSIGFSHDGTSNNIMIANINKIHMDSCQFIGSTGLPTIVYLNQINAVITNCTLSNNTSDATIRSVITLRQTGLRDVIHSCTISDNNMTGITLIETNVTFSGHNVIRNNRNTEGAGIKLISPAYIQIDGELLLYNNTADKHGGAILVIASQQRILQSIFRYPCSLMSDGNSSSVIFSGNRAGRGGSDMYGAILMGCNTSDTHVPHVGQSNETSWYFDTPLMKYLHFSNTDGLSSMSSDPIMVCFCNTTSNLPDCSDRTHHIQTYPGLEINTSIATVGYYGGTSPGDVLVSAQHAKLVRYYGQNETTNCFQLHILLQNTSSTTALVDIRVKNVVQGLGVSIGVDILECPIGFTQISAQCHCELFLDTNNVQCNASATPLKFVRSGNSWFAYNNNNNNTQCITGTTNCPFDYCNRSNVSFDIMAPDCQCVANRVGILCGQCQSHLSIMLGSNRCGTCSNWYLFLLPVFALAGIVLVAVLMFLNLSVSVGTINGLLFYVNMVKLNEAFFFPNSSVPVVSQFISWLNLDLGIEVCLFDGLDGYWNTWLQFAFPAYLFLLMGGIIVGCRYSVWLCRLCGSHAVPALATLFLMSYTKILLTVTNALSMYRLPCNDSILTVWSIDGNIEYGSGKHLILVVFSSCVLVVGLAYPVLVLCAPLLERYSHKCIPLHWWNPVVKFKPLLDAYGGPYKDKYRFWTGVTLMVRLTVTVTFSFTSGGLAIINACIITIFVVGIFIVWSFTKGVYNDIYLSTLEAFYLVNIFLLSTVSLTTASFGSKDYQIATIVSVSLSFVVCLVTMAMHLWWNFDLKKIKRRLGFKDKPEYIAVPQVAADNEEDRPPPGSPPSIVYGSHRGEHQFVLEFPRPHEELESSSPVLLAREPLLFDT